MKDDWNDDSADEIDWDFKSDYENFSEKLENLSTSKKILTIVCFLAIFGSLFYLLTMDNVQTVRYMSRDTVVCKEVYINGELNGTPCPQNSIFNDKETWEKVSGKDYENWTST